jgi:hypothetical protein
LIELARDRAHLRFIQPVGVDHEREGSAGERMGCKDVYEGEGQASATPLVSNVGA